MIALENDHGMGEILSMAHQIVSHLILRLGWRSLVVVWTISVSSAPWKQPSDWPGRCRPESHRIVSRVHRN